jgi:hypothetical protein
MRFGESRRQTDGIACILLRLVNPLQRVKCQTNIELRQCRRWIKPQSRLQMIHGPLVFSQCDISGAQVVVRLHVIGVDRNGLFQMLN